MRNIFYLLCIFLSLSFLAQNSFSAQEEKIKAGDFKLAPEKYLDKKIFLGNVFVVFKTENPNVVGVVSVPYSEEEMDLSMRYWSTLLNGSEEGRSKKTEYLLYLLDLKVDDIISAHLKNEKDFHWLSIGDNVEITGFARLKKNKEEKYYYIETEKVRVVDYWLESDFFYHQNNHKYGIDKENKRESTQFIA